MICAAALRAPSVARSVPSPLAWAGRLLSLAIGGFMAIDGLARLILGRALAPPSAGAPTLEATLQVPLGGLLLVAAGLYLSRPARWVGAALLLLAVGGVVAVETAAEVRSVSHILFWTYVGGLIVAGAALRRLRPACTSRARLFAPFA